MAGKGGEPVLYVEEFMKSTRVEPNHHLSPYEQARIANAIYDDIQRALRDEDPDATVKPGWLTACVRLKINPQKHRDEAQINPEYCELIAGLEDLIKQAFHEIMIGQGLAPGRKVAERLDILQRLDPSRWVVAQKGMDVGKFQPDTTSATDRLRKMKAIASQSSSEAKMITSQGGVVPPASISVDRITPVELDQDRPHEGRK